MKRKLIITNSIIVFVSLLTMLVVSMITITNQNNKFYQKQVTNYLKIACTNFDGSNFDDTKEYIKSLDKDIRLTIIESSTGKVVIDSFEDEINENHLDRPEINNLGEVYKRYSTTEKKNMLYVAEKVNNYYVRIAIPIGSVNKIIYTYVTISLIALTVILAFSIFAISFVNKKSLTPINSEVAKLATLANEDYQDVTIDDLPVVINSITNVLDNKIYEIESFKNLPTSPEVETTFKRKGAEIPVYKLHRIAGTVIAKDDMHSSISVLTVDSGVVTVKMNRDYYAMYNRRISEVQKDGTKKVIEQGWFSKGTLVVLQGIRRGDSFFLKNYKRSACHQLYKITEIHSNGTVEMTNERIDNEKI